MGGPIYQIAPSVIRAFAAANRRIAWLIVVMSVAGGCAGRRMSSTQAFPLPQRCVRNTEFDTFSRRERDATWDALFLEHRPPELSVPPRSECSPSANPAVAESVRLLMRDRLVDLFTEFEGEAQSVQCEARDVVAQKLSTVRDAVGQMASFILHSNDAHYEITSAPADPLASWSCHLKNSIASRCGAPVVPCFSSE